MFFAPARPAAFRAAFLIAAAAFVLGTVPTAACAADPLLVAYVAANGEVTVRKADSGNVVATIRPGLFEQTWQIRNLSPIGTFSPAQTPAGQTQTTSTIRATTSGATIAVQSGVSLAAPSVLRFSLALTPNKPLLTNSVHVSVSVPAGDWIGGKAIADASSVAVPVSASAPHLVSGNTGKIVLEKNAVRLEARAMGKSGMVQDNRAFGGSDLELRFGTQQDAGGSWAAGKTEKFELTVAFEQPVQIVREAPITLQAGVGWVPLDNKLDPAAGSALDFSKLLLDGPAGKYGRVIVRPDGHFGFVGKNAPVRFYGVNFAFSANFVTHDEADRIADRLARIGYNSVRIHHYEGELIDPTAPNTTTFRADRLDKLDYLLYALKKRGIYLTTDLFVSRPVKNEETGLANGASDFKAALLVSPPAMENWKAFSRNLLNHVNPYTKIAYKDEPALAFISVVNEPNLPGSLGGMTGALRDEYESQWRTYLATRYASDAALQTAWGQAGATRQTALLPKQVDAKTMQGRDLGAFLAFLHERGYHVMRDFLKNEIGTRALLTDNNGWSETPALMAARTELDYVDNHFYWDHPSFLENQWNLPSRGGSGGGSAVAAGGAGPGGLAQTRLFGKPFVVSEFNYAAPNRFRAEGGLLMGAASALQDWDAVWRFAYSHSRVASVSPAPVDYFNMANDPAGQASERAALLLFLRGDLRPAPGMVTLVRSRAELMAPAASTPLPAPGFGDLTLLTRIGTRIEDANAPLPPLGPGETRFTTGTSADALTALQNASALPLMNRTDLASGDRESETGEIMVDGGQNLLRIQTPRTVGGIANGGDTFAAGPLTISLSGTRAAVWASSLDGLPVGRSRRLLVVHVPDVENANMTFAGPDRQVLTGWGGLPHIVRQGKATLTFNRTVPGNLMVYRLDTAGNRIAPIALIKKNNAITFTLSTQEKGATGATLYYEVIAAPAVKAAAATTGKNSGRAGGKMLQ